MAETQTDIGRCPRCATELAPSAVIIEYRRNDGERSHYAECPHCSDVVRPR